MFDSLSRNLIAGLRLGAFKSTGTLQARGSVIRDATKGLTGPTAVPKGRYRIVSDLGVGAFGNVSLAEDEATGHEVAIRFLPRGLVGPSVPGPRAGVWGCREWPRLRGHGARPGAPPDRDLVRGTPRGGRRA